MVAGMLSRGRAWSPVGAAAELGSPSHLSPTEKASATEARYAKLKEQHSKLVTTHAELLRKVGPSPVGSGWDGGAPSGGRA